MKNDKTVGSSGIICEILKTSGGAGVRLVTDLVNIIVEEGAVPDNYCLKSLSVNIYRGKDGSHECSSYRGHKLLDQIMNMAERVGLGKEWMQMQCTVTTHTHKKRYLAVVLHNWMIKKKKNSNIKLSI